MTRMPDNFKQRSFAILCCLLFLAAGSKLLANDKASEAYPEQGKVIASTLDQTAHAPTAASQAQPNAGTPANSLLPVFRVETDTRVYQFEGKSKPGLTVGDTVQFRIVKDWAYVKRDGKEQKFKVIDTQLKDDD